MKSLDSSDGPGEAMGIAGCASSNGDGTRVASDSVENER